VNRTSLRPHAVGRPALVVIGVLAWMLVIPSSQALQVEGLQTPQSFIADPSGEFYFITNANGNPEIKDNNGFITKLDRDGKVMHAQFIRGGRDGAILHAPKGMAIVESILYVADLDTLRGFDTGTGRMLHAIPFTSGQNGQPVSLADVAYDGRKLLYVSDIAGNAIYTVDLVEHGVFLLVRDPTLAGPRGIAVHPKTGRLIVVSWNKGKILEVGPDGTITELVSNSFFSARFSHLGGVDFDSIGYMYVSDLTAGKVWRMRPDRRFDVIAEYLPSPADIGVDRKNHLILVPYEYGNAAEMNGLESPAKTRKKRELSDYGFGFMKKEGRDK
jgi:DNA-binding beta-propeller fold protein YncE